jgi:hypothetical protein
VHIHIDLSASIAAAVRLQGSALCVDIQGVGDLYTDPQIHTLDGQGYGDGNLALRGAH